MKSARTAILASVAGIFCIIAATAVLAATKRHRDKPLSVAAHFVPPDKCQIILAEQTFQLPNDEERMVAAFRKLRIDWRAISKVGGIETPYICIGHAIHLAQRGGFKKVRFTTGPAEH